MFAVRATCTWAEGQQLGGDWDLWGLVCLWFVLLYSVVVDFVFFYLHKIVNIFSCYLRSIFSTEGCLYER